jgi:hypothetical protein
MNVAPALVAKRLHDEVCAVLTQLGGTPVEQLIADRKFQKRADIYFEKERAVFEVKSLTEDYARSAKFERKARRMYDGWARQGFVPVRRSEHLRLNTHQLPRRQAHELIRAMGDPIQSHLKTASGQINATRLKLDAADAAGVLVLVAPNDLSLGAGGILYNLSHLLRASVVKPNGEQAYSGVDDVFLITVPLPDRQGSLRPVVGHVDRTGARRLAPEFVDCIITGWVSHYRDRLGQDFAVLVDMPEEALFDMYYRASGAVSSYAEERGAR